MRYSGIGGQAVMEGVMMKNQEKYAVAVRKPDGEIALEPILRGVFSFIESLYLGVATLTFSAFFLRKKKRTRKKRQRNSVRKKY